VRRAAGKQDHNMGNGLHVLMTAPTECVTDAITSRRGVITPVVLPCTGQHQQPSANPREFDSLVMGGCWAETFTVTHTYTPCDSCSHWVTAVQSSYMQLLQFGICNKLCIFRFLCCVWHSSFNIVLITMKGQIMKIWVQITTTKSTGKSSGKSIADTILFIAAVWNRAGHYIFVLWFFFFFPRFSVVADWMSTIFPHMVWP